MCWTNKLLGWSNLARQGYVSLPIHSTFIHSWYMWELNNRLPKVPEIYRKTINLTNRKRYLQNLAMQSYCSLPWRIPCIHYAEKNIFAISLQCPPKVPDQLCPVSVTVQSLFIESSKFAQVEMTNGWTFETFRIIAPQLWSRRDKKLQIVTSGSFNDKTEL